MLASLDVAPKYARNIHAAPMPRSGGLALFLTFFLCLALAGCYDAGGAGAKAALRAYGLAPGDASAAYFEALAWAADMSRP